MLRRRDVPQFAASEGFEVMMFRRIVDKSYDTAGDLLVRNRELLDRLSAELIEYETLDAEHQKLLIEEYTVDNLGVEELSLNRHWRS